MTSSVESEIEKELAALQLVFKGMLPNKVAEIETMSHAVLERKNALMLREFHMLVHSLAGTAGTFGAMAVSDSARELELLLNSLNNNKNFSQTNKSKITTLVENIKITAKAAVR